jgi:hypothetical protein
MLQVASFVSGRRSVLGFGSVCVLASTPMYANIVHDVCMYGRGCGQEEKCWTAAEELAPVLVAVVRRDKPGF